MGDSSETLLDLQKKNKLLDSLLDLQNRRDAEEYVRNRLLGGRSLNLVENSMPWILSHIDCFVGQSQGNVSINEVFLYPYPAFDDHDDGVWDKFGQAVGNLQALDTLHMIYTPNYGRNRDDDDADADVVPVPNWEILARILSHVRQKITLINLSVAARSAEESRSFARAIHGHPSITRFKGGQDFPYESVDTLYSALATLPALESIRLASRGHHTRPDEESALANPESLTDLLRSPSLRSVNFFRFYFTRALCQAAANAFMEGSSVTGLEFVQCSFSDEESATIMANGLSRKTSVATIEFARNQELRSFRMARLPPGATLLPLHGCTGLNPVFLSLGQNTRLKTLIVGISCSMKESLCTAIQNGLGMNETVEILILENAPLSDSTAALWCRALSFLRTNKTIKTFKIKLKDVTESCLSAFRLSIVAMLQENATLECLSIESQNSSTTIEDYCVLLTALQDNTTLKFLDLPGFGELELTNDEDKQMAEHLKKNYALEKLKGFDVDGDLGAILRLNEVGRRYLIEDGSSISKGVEVLSSVNNDIDCVFLHLLENPRLCDRRAVEMVSTGGRVNESDS
jgi:hypothetical protein